DHRGDAFGLGALDRSRFRTTRTGPKSTFVFDKLKKGSPQELRLEGDGGAQTRLRRIRLAQPTPEQLAKYAGSYHNQELATWYHISARDGSLYLRVRDHRLERLVAGEKDVFRPHLPTDDDNRIITFVRDAKDVVTGLSIDLWRVTNVRFEAARR